MTFAILSSYFEKLESTSSRLILIDILSDLFKNSPKEEIERIVYLTQGRIAPFFEATEIGMAEKQVAGAIAASLGIQREEVLKFYTKLGDMGAAVEKLVRGPAASFPPVSAPEIFSGKPLAGSVRAAGSPSSGVTPRNSISVSGVFEILKTIAKTSGEGTVEKRQTLLSDLLKKMDPLSSKFLVRIPLGNLRLGIGDPTILDGLALAKLGDKNKRKLLEGAYNRTSDLGLIAKTLWSEGLSAVEKLRVQVGKPIRSERCERLPNAAKVFEKMGSQVHSTPKYDGFRVQIHKNGEKVSMFSRNLENMTHMFPELIKGTLKQVKAKTAILDTEALAYNPDSEEFLPFQETTKRRRKHGIEEMAQSLPLKAFVFDILYKDGKSLIDLPLKERSKILKETIAGDPTAGSGQVLVPAPGIILEYPQELQIMLDDSISKGLEGVVVKRLDSKYEAGARNFNWVKLKRHSSGELQDTIDCVILGYIAGKGKRTAFGAGALLVGVYDEKKDEFATVSRIGTGLTDEEWQEIHRRADKIKVDRKPARVNSAITPSVWIKPEIVIEVLADEITRSPLHTASLALRFPRLVSFRTSDKKPEDATTVKELIEMYKQQGGK